MTKNLNIRAIGAMILSAILFIMLVGALLVNPAVASPVYAADGSEDGSQIELEAISDDTVDDDSVDVVAEQSGTANVVITITAPEGWSNDKAKITVSAHDALNTGNFEIVKMEAKIGENGSWQDITDDKYIEITENCSVYVQVTDQNDNVYSKSRSIKCFDTTIPTLNAAVSNGLLTVVGYDNDSGIKAFYVNGYEFTDFTNNTLNIRLQQFDTGYEYFTVQAIDNAGNMSEEYKETNPYYDDDTSDDDDKGASTLPTDAEASSPSSATATVTEHTKTDSDGNITYSSTQEQQNQSLEDADDAEKAEISDSDTEEESESGKEFYTIQTQSEKVFYLIIDRDGDEETVYFLTEIDENDLLNTTSSNSETLPKNSAALESAIPTTASALPNNNTESEVTESDETISEEEATEETAQEETETVESVSEENTKDSMMTYIILVIIGIGAIGGWFYLNMVKGKKEGFLDEDDEDDDEETYEPDDEDSNGDDFFTMDDKDSSESETVDESETHEEGV
jgi:hypothetical protein